MSIELLRQRLSRRRFLQSSAMAGAALTASSALPRATRAQGAPIKIGFLAALTGDVAGWGLPGLHGCEIWGEWVNAAGGVNIGGTMHPIEFIPFDDEYSAEKAKTGVRKLVVNVFTKPYAARPKAVSHA